MKTVRIISIFLVHILVSGITARHSRLNNIGDEDLRQFYFDFYDEETSTDDRKSTIDDYLDYQEEQNDVLSTQTNTVESIKDKPNEEENSDKPESSVPVVASLSERDPTFVLSKLLFHLAQLSG